MADPTFTITLKPIKRKRLEKVKRKRELEEEKTISLNEIINEAIDKFLEPEIEEEQIEKQKPEDFLPDTFKKRV